MTHGGERAAPRVSPYGAEDKAAAVRTMFDTIAPGYDRVNQLMTFGLDGVWRRAAAREAALPAGGLALDVGTGTGDLAFALARSALDARVIGLDYAAGMLAYAPAKARARGLATLTSWARGDGARLPFADATFDAVTSAFVLRNFADLDAAVADMARVLKPGGRLVALEASPGGARAWRTLTRLHFQLVVPALGALVTGQRGAYTYLGDSVAAFLSPAEFAHVLARHGLTPLRARALMGGTIALHRGVKPPRE